MTRGGGGYLPSAANFSLNSEICSGDRFMACSAVIASAMASLCPSARASLRIRTFIAAKWSSSSSVKTISRACSLISLSDAFSTKMRLIACDITSSPKSGRSSALPACLSRYSQRSSVVWTESSVLLNCVKSYKIYFTLSVIGKALD